MTAETKLVPYPSPADEEREGLPQWLLTTDHKRIGLLTIGTALFFFLVNGALAMTMRAQLAQPGLHILSPEQYLQFMTQHGTGMIQTVMTPLSLGIGVYLVPLQVGAPRIAAPRMALLGYWLYLFAGLLLVWGFVTPRGGASAGWWGYLPLSGSYYTPGFGESLWCAGVFMVALAMILQAASILWTILRMRAPGVTMMRMPVFCWTQLVNVMMVLVSFPALMLAMGIVAGNRIDPGAFASNAWVFGYEDLFWFYGHPVVYVMFFPFVGCVVETLSTFTGRRFFGYQGTVLSLLFFAAGSMSVWGHHLFASGQQVNDYFSLASIILTIPAGIEYFGFLGTLWGGRLRYNTPMLFALTFIPQFAIGGLTGILVANPAVDYHLNNSYFVLGHFHYTLLGGSFFGFLAGFYLWFPKATGIMLSERLGKLHWLLMTIGTNVMLIPWFLLGYDGMPRWMSTYRAGSGFTTLSLISTIGAGIIVLATFVWIYNIYTSVRAKVPAGPNPWQAHTLEWATSSPPPRFNYNLAYPVPRVQSYAPLLDYREQAVQRRRPERGGDGAAQPPAAERGQA